MGSQLLCCKEIIAVLPGHALPSPPFFCAHTQFDMTYNALGKAYSVLAVSSVQHVTVAGTTFGHTSGFNGGCASLFKTDNVNVTGST